MHKIKIDCTETQIKYMIYHPGLPSIYGVAGMAVVALLSLMSNTVILSY